MGELNEKLYENSGYQNIPAREGLLKNIDDVLMGAGFLAIEGLASGEYENKSLLLNGLNELLATGTYGEGLQARSMSEEDIEEWVDSEITTWQDTLDPNTPESEQRLELERRVRARIALVPESTIVIVDSEQQVVFDTISFLTDVEPEDIESWVSSTGDGLLMDYDPENDKLISLHKPEGQHRYIVSLSRRDHPMALGAIGAIIAAYKQEIYNNENLKSACFVSRIPSFRDWVLGLFGSEVSSVVGSDTKELVASILAERLGPHLTDDNSKRLLEQLLAAYIKPVSESAGKTPIYRDVYMNMFAREGAVVVKGVVDAMQYDTTSLNSGVVFKYE